ncbi:hypothetical protein BG004_007524 [Podila humilis]|nr:hypothetical protein BG004_007524 [Podila humilis]
MASYKRSIHINPQQEEPWLRYPDPLKSSSHGHSRAFSPTLHSSHAQPKHSLQHYHPDQLQLSTQLTHATNSSNSSTVSLAETSPIPGLHRSSTKLRNQNQNQHGTSSGLHLRHTHAHSHTHTQTHNHTQKPTGKSTNSKPRTLSDELNFALSSHSNHNDDSHSDSNSYSTTSSANNSTTNLYPSPVTPSDLLSISSYASSTSSATPHVSSASAPSNHFPLQRNRPESPVNRSNSTQKMRPSPLSINTANLADGHLLQYPHQIPQHQQQQTKTTQKQRPDSFHMSSPTSTVSRGSDGGARSVSSPRATAVPGSGGGLGTPPLPRLTRGASSMSSSASNSSCSNTSSPISSAAPCSILCQKAHHHSHSSFSPHHQHQHQLQHSQHHHGGHHHHACPNSHNNNGYNHSHIHKHTRQHRHHHPGCSHHKAERRERSETPLPMSLEAEMAIASVVTDNQDRVMTMNTNMSVDMDVDADVDEDGPQRMLPPAEPIVETSMVVATFGAAADQPKQQEEQVQQQKHAKEQSSETALGLYEEPPKKKMRSTTAIILGAAVETVILTGAVALSAYNLLTGKGKQDQVATQNEKAEVATSKSATHEPKQQEPVKPILQIQSAPVNIPRGQRHKTLGTGQEGRSYLPIAHSYHHSHLHNHKNSQKSRGSSRRISGAGRGMSALSSSLPHAQTHRFGPRDSAMLPNRPNTGTEDNDEQFLRLEAQLSSLIAEGKRALSSRIESWDEMSEVGSRR